MAAGGWGFPTEQQTEAESTLRRQHPEGVRYVTVCVCVVQPVGEVELGSLRQ